MPAPCSLDIRRRAITAYEAGEGSYREIGERFSVADRTVFAWVKRYRETGEEGPRGHAGGRTVRVDEAVLRRLVDSSPDATSWELAARYNRTVTRTERVHRSSVLRALSRVGYVYKKNGYVLRNRTGRTSSKSASASSVESGE